MDLGRRTLFKLAGVATAGSLIPGCQKEVNRLVPYLLPDEQIVPGVANWYASLCGECAAGCGILVRVMEGRAKKIEGNPDHPVNQGKLCAKGQASLQSLYNPDRLRHPFQREGPRGAGRFVPLTWEEGLQRLAQVLLDRRVPPMMVTRPVSGTLARLLSEFMDSIGGTLYFYAPDAELPLHAAWRESMGCDGAPFYDLAHTDYLLSFGAPFLEHWLSPVAMGIAFGQMRQGRATVRGRYVHIEPRMSVTGANADQWLPIRPGSEGMLALGIGQLILDAHRSTLHGQEFERFRRFYGSVRLEDIERATGLSRDVIVRLAQDFDAARAPVAIGGGSACSQTNGTLSLIAINGLNALASSMGRESLAHGVRRHDPRPDRLIPWLTERTVFELVEKQDTGAGSVLLLYGCNPLFTMPPSVPIKTLFEQASSVVSFSSFLDESSEYADLLLPDRDPLESWGDHVVENPAQTMGLSQPVVPPLYETQQIGDTILELSRRLNLGHGQAQTFYDLLRERWKTVLADQPHAKADDWFEQVWIARLQEGGLWRERSRAGPPAIFAPSRGFEQACFVGEEHDYPFIFHPYPSMLLGHGEGANRPWLQELPDALTTVVWGSWVEVNPRTAKDLGITHGDVVRVISPFATLTASTILFPGIHPDVVAMPLGQGHASYGRYAKNRGVNPAELLAPALDSMTGTLAAGATRVRIERTGEKRRLVTLERPTMEPSDLIAIDRR
ncbi:menaquinone reductase, molybdopterin-binding-like subunit [Nitrospira sp.]|nr:menaquinone reductase, molybdopterin-binding-like subunit [Nitrospira sp.]